MSEPLFEDGDRVQFDRPLSAGRRVAGYDRIISTTYETSGHMVLYRYELESGITVRREHILRKLPPNEMG